MILHGWMEAGDLHLNVVRMPDVYSVRRRAKLNYCGKRR